MQPHLAFAAIALTALLGNVPPASAPTTSPPAEPNPRIDMDAYLRVAKEAAAWRESHRVNEAEFLRMSRQPGTAVLDARSPARYAMLHVKGAINLTFADLDVASLARVLPDRNARVLIYCNNNFFNGELAFPEKRLDASLNLSTFIALYSYGYRNVYELAPLRDVKRSKLEFEGSEVERILR